MFYPQPQYQYQAYPTSWPPAPVPLAGVMPTAQPVMPHVDMNARGTQPMMMQQLPVSVPYAYAAGPSLQQQQDQQQQQDSNANEQEPDVEEARYTMLAQYYKNPYYGLVRT